MLCKSKLPFGSSFRHLGLGSFFAFTLIATMATMRYSGKKALCHSGSQSWLSIAVQVVTGVSGGRRECKTE